MIEAFAAKKDLEILQILFEEFSDEDIKSLPQIVVSAKAGGYVVCYVSDSVYEWDEDGFYTRGRNYQYDPQIDHCCIAYKR